MRLKLTLNLGTADKDRLQIDGEGHEGDVVEVTEERGKEMIRRGWAVEDTGNPAPAPAGTTGAESPHTAGQPVPPAPHRETTAKPDTSRKTAEEKGKPSPIPADRRQAPGGTGL